MDIPYWPNRRLRITAHKPDRRDSKTTLMITPLYTTKELESYGYGKWFMRNWKFIDLPF